jgi:adenosylmethionine---8-amino-7-oxononanoate aminotransferase
MNNLLEADKNNIWHPFTPLLSEIEPLLITSAEGVYLNTSDNRKIIDAISSWWVNLHGHSHPKIAEAVSRQAATLEHVIFAGFTHEPAITLSQNLLSVLPANFSKIFFSDNGSTAVEVALKMAIQFWHNQNIPRHKIIALNGAYHGDTFGSMAVGDRSIFTNPFKPYLFDVAFIDFPHSGMEEKILSQFKEIIDRGDLAAFIYEPLVQGASGMRTYSNELLDQLMGYAHANEVLCIADEVFTGFGRTGKLFASDYLKNKPDLIALSKGLTGGTLPLGVTAASSKIVSAFQSNDFLKTFFHGHSFTANPIACAAANASFELLMQPECNNNILRISNQHKIFAEEIRISKVVKVIHCIGTILSIEVHSKEESSYTNTLRKRIYNFFISRNILLRPLGNVIYIIPPYCITEDQLNYVYQTIKEFLQTIE